MSALIAPHPFGEQITEASLVQEFSVLSHWEERYRQLILLSRKLPPLPEALKTPPSKSQAVKTESGSDIR